MNVARKKGYRRVVVFSLFILTFVLGLSLFVGNYDLTVGDIFSIFMKNPLADEEMKKQVLLSYRIPRIILSAMVGIMLSTVGAYMQGILKNPLASPEILGTASATGFGTALGILIYGNNNLAIYVLSFAMGVLSLAMVYGLCVVRKKFDILSIILSGMITSSVFISLISLSKYVADVEESLPAITFWLMGSFSSASFDQIYMIAPIFFVGIVILFLFRWKLNILTLGDEEAILLGIRPKSLKLFLLGVSTLMISASVTAAGIIGWIGLVIPHLSRKFIGSNHGYLIPICALFGAIFMVGLDTLARILIFAEIPIGILTGLVGAPLFAILLVKSKRRE